jgi:hypothetical protein
MVKNVGFNINDKQNIVKVLHKVKYRKKIQKFAQNVVIIFSSKSQKI